MTVRLAQAEAPPQKNNREGVIEHPSGSIALLKTPTDLRDARQFHRTKELLNGTKVRIFGEAASSEGTAYSHVQRMGEVPPQGGWVKRAYVKEGALE